MLNRFLLSGALSLLLVFPAVTLAQFADVDPTSLSLTLNAGDVHDQKVSIRINPFCFRPIELDVVASEPGAMVTNLTGVLVNNCGGDQSTFDIEITGTGSTQNFDLRFIDAELGGLIDSIPVRISPDGTGSLHGVKWLDGNGNGLRDADEPGLAGVTVYVDVNDNGMLDAGEPATLTMDDDPNSAINETGRYWLQGIAPGSYALREVVPPAQQQTFPPGGAHAVLLNGGTIEGLDFGNQPLASGSLHGRKWIDKNGDGRRDPNEPGLPGVTIYLDLNNNGRLDDGEPATVTSPDNPDTDFDEAGRYWIMDLDPGMYVVREVVPQGFTQTFPECDGSHFVQLGEDDAIDGLDFGNRPSALERSIHGVKWLDANGDRIRDRNEPGLPGVTIYSDRNENGVLDGDEPATVSMEDKPDTAVDESGRYWLTELQPGRHIIREVVPDGFVQTFPGGDGGHIIELVGAGVEGLDFGNRRRPEGSIHGIKWLDANGNSRRNGNEPGLPSVIIYIDLNANRTRDENEPATRTMRDDPDTDFDESGRYWLTGLPPGRYVVREVVPDGFLQTFPGGEGSHIVELVDGTVEGVDFGNRRNPEPSIHGTKWLDANANGRRDDNEPGLAGVVIYSDLNHNGRLDDGEPVTRTVRDDPSTDFDETGRYWLTGLRQGPHFVREVVPDGFVQTFPRGNGRHLVTVKRDAVEGVDFGNRRARR